MAKIKPIPDGYRRVTPYLIISGAGDAIDYYTKTFGMKERMRMGGPDGKVGHAELELGDSVVMLADEFPDMGIKSPKTLGGTPAFNHIYVEDVDATFNEAVKTGSKVVQPLENKFYGDRAGQIEDPFGHMWSIASHVEDVSEEEMMKRAQEMADG